MILSDPKDSIIFVCVLLVRYSFIDKISYYYLNAVIIVFAIEFNHEMAYIEAEITQCCLGRPFHGKSESKDSRKTAKGNTS